MQVTVGPDGMPRIRGSRQLKSSQEYPIAFGRAISKLMEDNVGEIEAARKKLLKQSKVVQIRDLFSKCTRAQSWPDARVKQTIDSLVLDR